MLTTLQHVFVWDTIKIPRFQRFLAYRWFCMTPNKILVSSDKNTTHFVSFHIENIYSVGRIEILWWAFRNKINTVRNAQVYLFYLLVYLFYCSISFCNFLITLLQPNVLQSVLFAASYFNQYFQAIAKIKIISLVTFLVIRLEHRQIPEQEIVFFP